MSQIGTSPLDSTVKVSDPAKQVASDFDGGSVDASFETGDGCVTVGWDGEGNATVGVLGVGGDVVCTML